MYTKVTKKGQVTIPKPIREKLKIGNNGAVMFIIENDEVKLRGVPGGTAESLAGSLKSYVREYVPLDKVRKQVQEEVAGEAAERTPNNL